MPRFNLSFLNPILLSFQSKMGRRNIERKIVSCLKRAETPCCKPLQSPYLALRLSHTASKSGNFSQNTKVYHHEKGAKKVKIGNKIYILETPEAQSSKEKSAVLSKKSNSFGVTNLSHGKTHDILGLKDTERNKGIRSKVHNSKSVDLESSLAQFSREGLEFSAILRQPLINTTKEKPFLVKIPTLMVDSLSRKSLPFYTPGVREVLRATQTITDQVRAQLRNENHIRKLGPQGFSNYMKDCRVHMKDFDNLLFEYFESGDDTLSVVSPVIEAYWDSLKPTLKDIAEPLCLKKTAIHPNLRYKAEIDYVAIYRSRPCLVKFQMASWKNGIDEKVLLENRLQLLACLGALNFDPSWSHQISSGVLIRAYSDGSPADVVVNSVKGSQYHWKTWLRMVEQFWRNYDKQCGNKEVLSDISPELKEEYDWQGKESERLLADNLTSTPQFNRKIENVTDFSSSCVNSSTENPLSNVDCQVHKSNIGDMSESKETTCHQTTNDTIPEADLKGISSFKADDQNEKNNAANFENPIPMNSSQDCDNQVKHEQTATPPDDVRESEKERPQTRVTVLLNSLKNLWKS